VVIFRISNEAHNLKKRLWASRALFQMKGVAHGIDAMKVLAGELFIDNSHLLRSCPVLVIEFAPRQKTDAHRLEIAGTRAIKPSLFVAGSSRRTVGTDAVAPTTSTHGDEAYLRRGDHSRQRGEPLCQQPTNAEPLGFRIRCLAEIDCGHKNIPGVE